MQNGAEFNRKLEPFGSIEKERIASASQSEQFSRAPKLLLRTGKGTDPSVRITRCEEGESQVGQKPHLSGKRRRSEREHGVKRASSALKEGGFQGGEKGQAVESPHGKEGSISG